MDQSGGNQMLEKPLIWPELDDAALYKNWVSRRAPENLSTNAGAPVIAFQGWRQFKEAFAPELVESAICETAASLGRAVKSCLDPFGGSGTTALTCQFLGVLPTTIEVNPFLADLIAAKLSDYNFELLPTLLRKITDGRVRRKIPTWSLSRGCSNICGTRPQWKIYFPKGCRGAIINASKAN